MQSTVIRDGFGDHLYSFDCNQQLPTGLLSAGSGNATSIRAMFSYDGDNYVTLESFVDLTVTSR